MAILFSNSLKESAMKTANLFTKENSTLFLEHPNVWSCNCGEPLYSLTAHYSFAEEADKTLYPSHCYDYIICSCGHMLTQFEFKTFKNSLMATMVPCSDKQVSGIKHDNGKLRIDLLLDIPRALKAIADLMQKALVDYEESSWLDVPDAVKRYRAAHLRHTIERAINPIDPQFGLDHDVATALNSMFVLELRLREEEKNES